MFGNILKREMASIEIYLYWGGLYFIHEKRFGNKNDTFIESWNNYIRKGNLENEPKGHDTIQSVSLYKLRIKSISRLWTC